MNARTADGGIGDFVSAVYYLHPDGTLGEFKPSGAFGYRAFHLPPSAVLIGCRLQLHRRPLPRSRKKSRAPQAEKGDPAAGARVRWLRLEKPSGRSRLAADREGGGCAASASTAPRSRPSTATSSSIVAPPGPPTS
jgi:hypothetical protein